jgi:succinate dehydrogenase/fumarate reductase cytochrome b subunit
LTGAGMTVLFLLLGTVLDYAVTQVLSQFFIPNCSEDCYFQLINTIFVIVVVISLAAGIRSGMRTYNRLSK